MLRPRPRLVPVMRAIFVISLPFIKMSRSGNPPKLEWVGSWFILDCDPMVAGEFANDPFAAKSTDAAIFLAAKWSCRSVMNAVVVDVRHADLELLRELNTPLTILREHGA